MDVLVGVSGLIALVVAMVLMYLVLRKYTFPAVENPFFSDPTLFTLMAIGLIEGTFLFFVFMSLVIPNIADPNGFLCAICFAAIIELAKLITMNLKRFAGKSDTIFYGFGLGIGIGAAMGVGIIFVTIKPLNELGMDLGSVIVTALMLLIFVFSNAATGLIIGEGVARYKAFEFTLKALILSAIANLLLVAAFNIPGTDTWIFSVIILVADLAYIAFILYRGAFVSLPRIVDEVIRQEKRINDMKKNQQI